MENFQCLRCGLCCHWKGIVKLSDAEADAIAGYLGMEAQQFIDTMTRISPDRTTLALNEQADGTCIFYDEGGKGCRINPVKPQQCRDFPKHWNFPGWERQCAGGKALCRQTESDGA